MANIHANYLQEVTKDTLENQVGLGLCMARFASHYGIIGAHPKQSRFQLPLRLGALCLVISQLTIGILGILRRHYIPLATHPHTTTGVNGRSSNNIGTLGHVSTAAAATTAEATATSARLAVQNWRNPTQISD